MEGQTLGQEEEQDPHSLHGRSVPSNSLEKTDFYVPEAYIMYFIWRCWFLNCSQLLPPPTPIHYNTRRHWKGWALKLIYIKLPIYLFLSCLDLMILMRSISITKVIGRGGPWNRDFFWPTPSDGLLILQHQNHYVPRHINNRNINNY